MTICKTFNTPFPEAILFDADGTLYDSEILNYEANRLAARDLRDFEFTWDDFNLYIRQGEWSGFMVLEAAGHNVDREKYLELKLQHFQSLVKERLEPQSGLLDFLKWCKSKDLRLGVVSASRLSLLRVALDALNISAYFEFIISLEDIDNRPKPQILCPTYSV